MAVLTGPVQEIPETELLDGKAYRRMSPRRRHGRIQAFLLRVLEDQGAALGQAVPEWRCAVGKAYGSDDRLVPDVSWVSDARMRALDDEAAEEPPFAPDIIVEVRSPGDDLALARRKIARYAAAGAVLVLDVDSQRRIVAAHTAQGVRVFGEDERFESPAVPWLSFEVRAVFAAAQRRPC